MALKYYFEYNDIKNVVHRAEIYNDSYSDDSIEIVGRVLLDKAQTDDTLEAIRGTGLSLDLEANVDLNFEDIYTADERIYSVKYYRNEVLIFYGWISPSDIYQSYVDSVWNISIECQDGLGYLKNLSYVDNDTGLPFSGKQSGLEIISNCLKRTNLDQNINASVEIYYEGLADTENVLENIYLNANRYVKDDDKTYMDCDAVLRSVLEIFSACITQHNGEWYIYKPNDLADNDFPFFFSFDIDGVFVENKSLDISVGLGSQPDGFYPHYVNSNQQVSTENPIGAFSINYKYGLVASFFDNIYLKSSGNPLVFDEWTVNNNTHMDAPADNLGLLLSPLSYGTTPELVMTSDSFSFVSGNVIAFRLTYFTERTTSAKFKYYIKVILDDGTDTYYLENNGNWSSSDVFLSETAYPITKTNIITSNNMPIDGSVHIEIYTAVASTTSLVYRDVFISECYFYPINEELQDIKGEIYSFQVNENPSNKIEDVKEVYNGDEPTEVYDGTIYESDQNTPTEFWYRGNDSSRRVALLRIMGEDRMKMYNKPLRVFSGDVFGYVDYLSVIYLDGFDNVKFMPIEYSYDSYNNITTLKLKEIVNNPIGGINFTGLDYSLTFDYGTVVNPTITG